MLLITGCLAGSEMFVCCQRDQRWARAIALPLPPTQPSSLRQPPAPICVTAWSSRTKTMPQGTWTRAPPKPAWLRGGFTLCLIEQSYGCIKPCNIFVCKPQLWITQVKVAQLFFLQKTRENKRRPIWSGWDRQAADSWRRGADSMCSPHVLTQSKAMRYRVARGWGWIPLNGTLILSWPITLEETLRQAESFMTFNLIKADKIGLEDTRDITALESSKVCEHKWVRINIWNVSWCMTIQACVCPYLTSIWLC